MVGGTPSQVWMVQGYPEVPPTRSGWWGGTWGTRQPGLDGEGVPRVPLTRSGWWGIPGVPTRPGLDGVPLLTRSALDSSIARTCYAAGGVPLAFMREDFLVENNFVLEQMELILFNPLDRPKDGQSNFVCRRIK